MDLLMVHMGFINRYFVFGKRNKIKIHKHRVYALHIVIYISYNGRDFYYFCKTMRFGRL